MTDNQPSMNDMLKNETPSTFTIYITDDHGQEVFELNTTVKRDMLSSGDIHDAGYGLEIERDLAALAVALGINPSQAGEIIDNIQYGINEGCYGQHSSTGLFHALTDRESMYADGYSPRHLNMCDWSVIKNKQLSKMSPAEQTINQWNWSSLDNKEQYLKKLTDHANNTLGNKFSIILTDHYGQEVAELPVKPLLNGTLSRGKAIFDANNGLELSALPCLVCEQWAPDLKRITDATDIDSYALAGINNNVMH